LTHHATTLLLAPALLAYLFVWRRDWWRNGRAWRWALLAALPPLLLYLYIPLRSGPDASPWYHQRLGDGVLTLFDNSLPALLDFITGRSISVGFYDLNAALAGAPTAFVLWLRHFEWTGLVLMLVGLYVLIRLRAWPLLALTGVWFVTQQLFNLFYAIGDIFVYYIPLYLIACLWIGFRRRRNRQHGFRFDGQPGSRTCAGRRSKMPHDQRLSPPHAGACRCWGCSLSCRCSFGLLIRRCSSNSN
jgi:hypothetical protein